jgi:cohesin complex subunit SCC1
VDFEDRPAQPHSHHVARAADITLATADELQFDLDDPGYGLDLGPSDGIGSQDFDLDLGLDFGDNLSAVEVGRDAADPRLSDAIGGQFDGVNGDLDRLSNRSRDLSEHPFADIDMDFGGDLAGTEMNLGLDFGDREKTPGQTRSPSRACKCHPALTYIYLTSDVASPLTEGPVTPPPDANITPRKSPTKHQRQPKPQKQIIDNVTELADGPGARIGRGRNAGLGAPTTKDVSEIVTSQHFLPRSSVVMRLLEIRDDPLAHFLPTITKDGNSYFCAAPPGLAPELAELFMRPLKGGLANKRKGGELDKGGNKKMRMFGEDLDDVEQGMHAGSMPPSVGLGSDILGRGSVGPGLDFGDMPGIDDFQMDVGGDFDVGGDPYQRGKSVAHTDQSRMSTPGAGLLDDGEETYADLTCPIAMFDVRPNTQSQNQTQETETEAAGEGKGYSKNTVKALGIIRKELMPRNDGEVEDEEVDKVLSFKKMSEKVLSIQFLLTLF